MTTIEAMDGPKIKVMDGPPRPCCHPPCDYFCGYCGTGFKGIAYVINGATACIGCSQTYVVRLARARVQVLKDLEDRGASQYFQRVKVLRDPYATDPKYGEPRCPSCHLDLRQGQLQHIESCTWLGRERHERTGKYTHG